MGFPFTIIKRAPGIVYTWEKNDWSRRHGYQMPIDLYLVMQWMCLLLLDSGFFCFLIYFATARPASSETTLEALLNDLPPTDDNPYTTWSCLTSLVKILSISTSMVETEDPVVTKQRHQVSRSQTYARRYGIPVIDSFTGICNICRIKVSKQTRHCKLCNKCVGRMDHHCKWLNCCIGQSNYRLFLVLVISAFIALFWYTYIALWITWSCFYDKHSFMVNALSFFDVDSKHVEDINLNRIYHTSAAITMFITLIALISFVSITRLLVFHIKLAKMGITTIEYLNLPAYRNSQQHLDSESDSDDDEYDDADYDSDYYYSEAHAWKGSASRAHYHQWAICRLYRMVAHRVRRAWIVTLRAVIPNYRYRRLNKSKQRRTCVNSCCLIPCSTTSKKPHLLPTASHLSLKKQSGFKKKTHDSVNMEEFFATKTIRPIVTLSEEEGEPDYSDDMGLDLAILDEEEERHPVKPKANKLARLLDMSEEETLMRVQQEQQQLQTNRVLLDIPKEEDEEEHALSEL
ncbi:hypothetical protein MUCCIDRAFT_106302 [Mucor lusitanicus CBS 277.49]|uniref:Palmitoyltransferase n=1 Tax=Mucor lusitanicus CBS 277.49 TaxID=747725 RepID=A0A162MUY6_MUCCL|nr:hypothetical protein MUCCIDRAFT_106302 [Mucor lusitanicus CBS 277.49]